MNYSTDKLEMVKIGFLVKFDLEDQGDFPRTIIGIVTKVFNTSEPNLVILASTGDEFPMRNKSSQWLPNTPFASISECLVS